MSRFISAFNEGDQSTLQQVWAKSGDGWYWFSTDGPDARTSGEAKDRGSLLEFFARRHAQAEALHLTSFRFNGTTENGVGGNFQFTLTRAARDLKATDYVGKGLAICTTSPITLGVWSMAREPGS